MKKILFAVALLLGVMAAPSQAEPHRPYHQTTVRWVVATRDNLAVDDRYVTLVGHVTRRIGDEEYWFTDGTGSVRLDSENFDLPVGPRLVIGGRIDQAYLGFGHLEVDVRHWHYAPAHHPAHKAAAGSPAPAPAAHEAKSAPAPASSTTPPAETAPVPAAAASSTPISTATTPTNAAPLATPAVPAEPATTNQSLTPPQETH